MIELGRGSDYQGSNETFLYEISYLLLKGNVPIKRTGLCKICDKAMQSEFPQNHSKKVETLSRIEQFLGKFLTMRSYLIMKLYTIFTGQKHNHFLSPFIRYKT